jgi:hypothetical protein
MDAHLRDLRYFVAVAEELNFTRAAERLHISQPALSKQIRGLETALRARLFLRDRRQVSLTAAGTVLLNVARPLLDRWDEGTSAVASAVAAEARRLRIGTLTSIGRDLYPESPITSPSANPVGGLICGRSAGPTRPPAFAARSPTPRSCGCRSTLTTSPSGC